LQRLDLLLRPWNGFSHDIMRRSEYASLTVGGEDVLNQYGLNEFVHQGHKGLMQCMHLRLTHFGMKLDEKSIPNLAYLMYQ